MNQETALARPSVRLFGSFEEDDASALSYDEAARRILESVELNTVIGNTDDLMALLVRCRSVKSPHGGLQKSEKTSYEYRGFGQKAHQALININDSLMHDRMGDNQSKILKIHGLWRLVPKDIATTWEFHRAAEKMKTQLETCLKRIQDSSRGIVPATNIPKKIQSRLGNAIDTYNDVVSAAGNGLKKTIMYEIRNTEQKKKLDSYQEVEDEE